MPTLKGFKATIYDAKTSLPLPEYSCPRLIDHASNVSTTYIETTANQTFTIVLVHDPQIISQTVSQHLPDDSTQIIGLSSVSHETMGEVGTGTVGTAVYVDGVYADNGLTGPGVAEERRWFGKRVDYQHIRPFVFRNNTAGTPSLPLLSPSISVSYYSYRHSFPSFCGIMGDCRLRDDFR